MTEQTRAIIDYAYDDNAKDMRDSLYAAIHDKVTAHIEAHKEQVARTLITPEELEEPEEIETEEEQTETE